MVCAFNFTNFQRPVTCSCRSDVPPCKVGKTDSAGSRNTPDVEPPATVVEDACKVEKDRSTADTEKDDMMVRRISVSHKPPAVTLSQFLPVPFSAQQKGEDKKQISPQKEKKQSSLQAVTILPPRNPQAPTTSTSDSPSQQTESSKAEDSCDLSNDVMRSKQMCSPIQNSPACADPKSQPEETLETPDFELLRIDK
ncbi:unnamed protein product [Ranitomeya imitator]|uniref:Uncharacterized protein n=1 Tax=Ranitomeya imitator TaxID=111125 RepID=A0ABN9KV62_9NEOB|nr:unnamed protein product [Ranitomeya imitator]